MEVKKKITDFIKLEDGNIGESSAMMTGAILATTVLGGVLLSEIATAKVKHQNHHGNGHCNGGHGNSHYDCTISD